MTRLSAVRAHVLSTIERRGPIRGWSIDDTGVPKTGTHSVGVARQASWDSKITARLP
jgi:SRSO17 transposase